MLETTISINQPSYRKLRPSARWPNQTTTLTRSAVADTGAQLCVSGPEIIEQHPHLKRWLLPTKIPLRGVNRRRLTVLGALIVNIKCLSGETKEVMYVCEDVRGMCLSLTALKNLNIVNKEFPIASGSVTTITKSDEPTNQVKLAPCGCPLRTPPPGLPDKMPFPATDEYRQQIQDWIKERYSTNAFNTCPHQKLQTMKGEPLKIIFADEHTPYATHKPIPVPHHWKEEVKRQLDSDVALGIIEPVPQGTPTKWCARMVVVPKKDGKPRRTVDLQNLNKVTLRETHHTPSPFNIVSIIPPGKKKTVLDAWNGYHSVLLSPDARDATTFITEWGRYRYLRAPQGFHASSDGYTKRFDDITSGFPRVTRCIDDSLLWDDDTANSFWHTLSYIQFCAKNGIVFNPEKFKFAEDTIEFAGFDVTLTGYKPPSKMIKAIQDFPSPSNITGVRSWFGLVNQISYTFSQAQIMAPFRELLERSRPFYWDDTLESIFQESKKQIVSSIMDGVATFEVSRPTCLGTDWSKTGIGFTLSQKHCSCPGTDPLCGTNHWKVVYAGSRFTTDSESRYAPIEGEALAVLFALESCRMFVLGCQKLIVAVDHKPLVPIFNDRDLDKITNPRVLKIRERTLLYRFTVMHIPGIKNTGPNTMSRIPVPQSTAPGISVIEQALINNVNTNANMGGIHIARIKKEAAADNEYIQLLKMISAGFPKDKHDVPPEVADYWQMRNELYTIDGVIFAVGRPLIPRRLRQSLLQDLHIGHQGTNAMKANARQRFFWPQMNNQIQQLRYNCRRCNEIAPSQRKEPQTRTPTPDHPFQQVVTDLFHMSGTTYLIYADRYTGWTEVSISKNPDTKTITNTLRKYFTTFGVPEEVSSDGGPPYNSHDFNTFLRSWGVRHRS